MNTPMLEDVYELRKQKNYVEAKKIMNQILNTGPDNAFYNYQMAWCHDNLGEESKAIPYYEKAIQIGLDDKTLKDAYIGLGSTYRVLKKFKKSKEVFEKAIQRFPNVNSIKVFYAMTLYNLGEQQASISLLLGIVNQTTDDPEIKKYQSAIDYYKDHLDEFLL